MLRGRSRVRAVLLLGFIIGVVGCAHRGERVVVGVPGAVQTGYASWYGKPFNGRPTASGEIYNMYDLTAAHKTLPFGTRVRVTRRDTGASVVVRINDRGPFVRNRIIDLSYAAAKKIGLDIDGVAPVRLTVLGGGVTPRRTASPPRTRPPQTQPSPPVAALAPRTVSEGCWWVQIGSFQDEDNALRAREILKINGQPSVVTPGPNGFHRVRVGPYASRHDAERARRRLITDWPPAQVVSTCSGS